MDLFIIFFVIVFIYYCIRLSCHLFSLAMLIINKLNKNLFLNLLESLSNHGGSKFYINDIIGELVLMMYVKTFF